METNDAKLVDECLEATKHLTQQEAAGVLMVSQKTVSAWRAGARPTLSTTRRRQLLEILRTKKDGKIDPPAWAKADGMKPSDLTRQIDAVLNGEGEPWEKRYLIAEIAAAYRSSGYAFDADGARFRSRAMDRAERRALLRDRREWKRTFNPTEPLDRPADEKGKKTGTA